jgi:2-hydroxychromene-2-carboxylate isomerase
VALPEQSIQPVFYYDLGSPQCYIAAELIMPTLPVVPEWEPVPGSGMDGAGSEPDRGRLEARARELGLQPLRWPPHWPPDTELAMRAATYAKQVGRAVAFSLAAFRQEFAGGRDLGDEDTVLLAAAACEMHPTAVRRGVTLRSVATALTRAVERAAAAGVSTLPAIQIGELVFEGSDSVEQATHALGGAG